MTALADYSMKDLAQAMVEGAAEISEDQARRLAGLNQRLTVAHVTFETGCDKIREREAGQRRANMEQVMALRAAFQLEMGEILAGMTMLTADIGGPGEAGPGEAEDQTAEPDQGAPESDDDQLHAEAEPADVVPIDRSSR